MPVAVHIGLVKQVGQVVRRAVYGRRSPDSGRRERRLLADLARQAALILELRRARERLVLAREEERRRLRGDLHDGVGPTLADMGRQVRAARRLVLDGGPMANLLDQLDADLVSCSRDIGRLVDQLRPAALDRGLMPALHAEAARFRTADFAVELAGPTTVDGVPAAVEVAAYRTVSEALTIAARRADARRCQVSVRSADQLELEIVDDGRGAASDVHNGLMEARERAEELGGTLILGTPVGGGTRVLVRLPLPDRPEYRPTGDHAMSAEGAGVEPARV